MDFVIPIIAAVVGLTVGILVARIFLKPKAMGVLRMHVDPDDGPYLFTELWADPNTIMQEKSVTFIVNTDPIVSQK